LELFDFVCFELFGGGGGAGLFDLVGFGLFDLEGFELLDGGGGWGLLDLVDLELFEGGGGCGLFDGAGGGLGLSEGSEGGFEVPPHPGTFAGQSHTDNSGLKTVPSAQFCDVK